MDELEVSIGAERSHLNHGSIRSDANVLSQTSNGQGKAGEEFVVGIQKDVERLVTMLTVPAKGGVSEEEARPDVLAIVGMGGSGKTTLAKNIVNHPKVKSHFKFQAWISLSQKWTSSEVLSELHQQLQHQRENLWFFSTWFWRKINCLVVLDNVWDCKSIQDELLSKIIQCDYDGSSQFKDLIAETKVVIAGRHSQQPSTKSFQWSFYEVRFLNEKDEWEVFIKVYKSSHNGAELAEQYHDEAKKHLKNCQGLTSAIVELGRLFMINDSNNREMVRSEVTENVSNYLYLPESNKTLALSYHHLPHYLKPCFLYFGLFPKGSILAAGRLMRIWIAEGFVRECRDNETLEEVAQQLLQELIEHNIVQVVKWTYAGKPKSVQVHNMMTDLCIKEAQKFDFLYSSESSNQNAKNVSHRAAIINHSKGFNLPVENGNLRSLLIFGQGVDQYATIGNHRINLNLALVLKKFKLLRVLDLCGIRTSDGVMPKHIGNLVYLRYLRIRSTNISKLPDTIGNLRELVSFVYRNVVVNNEGIKLPNVLWKLSNLRHLYLPLEKMSRTKKFKLHTLQNLQTLWGVRAGIWMVKEMQKINPNLNKLCIQGIEDHKQILDSFFNCPIIKTQDHIRSLALEWYGFSLEGLGQLCSKKNLLKLRLKGFAPNMSTPLLPSNLQKLELFYTQLKNPESMAALGNLPYLKFLKLAKDSYMGSEWNIEGQNIFPQLEVLELSDLPFLEKWFVSKGAISCLKRLSVESCPRLKQIPEELRSNRTLEITARLENINSEASSSRGQQF